MKFLKIPTNVENMIIWAALITDIEVQEITRDLIGLTGKTLPEEEKNFFW